MTNLAFDMPRTLLRQLLVRSLAPSIRMSRDRLSACPDQHTAGRASGPTIGGGW